MSSWANYKGRDIRELECLVVYPDAEEGINKDRRAKGQPEIDVAPLKFGMGEVMEIVNSLDAKLLSGPKATVLGLIDALKDGIDVIFVISHGEEDGFFLTDGKVIASELTTLIRASGAFLTVLNTCSSEKVAEAVALELGTALICTVSPVPDRQALITGVVFAQKLAQGLDYVTAYELAKPGQNSVYVLKEARSRIMSDRQRGRNPYTPGQTAFDAETLSKIINTVEELDLIINGSQRLGLPPFKDTIASVQSELKLIKSQFGEIQVQLNSIKEERRASRLTIIVEAIAIVVLVVTVIVLALKLGGVF